MTEARPFSSRLICSQFDATAAASPASTVPKTCGCRRSSLSWMPRATSARVNAPDSAAMVAWNTTWNRRSPSSSSRCSTPGAGLRVVALDGLDHLVGLLDDVPREAVVGLLAVPRALLAQRAHQVGEPHELLGHGRADRGDEHRREVVGCDAAVEVGPVDLGDPLVGEAESLHDHRAIRHVLVVGELDVGQDVVGVAVRDQQGARRPGGIDGEAMAVDQPHTGLDGVDAQVSPGQVEERHARHDLHLDPVVGEQERHGALEHERRPGYGVADLAVPVGLGRQVVDDGPVDLLEGASRFVDVVVALAVGVGLGRRVPPGSQPTVVEVGEAGRGAGRGEVSSAGAEPDDDDRGPLRPAGHDPAGTGWGRGPLGGSTTPIPEPWSRKVP